jgi:hypothetical protein
MFASLIAEFPAESSESRLQLFHLFFARQGVNNLIQVSIQNLLQIVKAVVDAMVGNSVLGKIIGADLFRALSAAHLHPPLLVYAFSSPSLFMVKQPGPKDRHCLHPVSYLRPLILAGSGYAGGQVREANRRGYFVHVLPAGAPAVEEFHFQVVGIDTQVKLFSLGQHRYRGCRGVDSPRRFGDRHSLHTVNAAFVLQSAKSTLSFDFACA